MMPECPVVVCKNEAPSVLRMSFYIFACTHVGQNCIVGFWALEKLTTVDL